MTAFRRVEDSRARPTALGILVPPGSRTVVIVRPRALAWDLLALRPGGDGFQEFDRDEAAGVARRLQLALAQALAGPTPPLDSVAHGSEPGFVVRLVVGEFVWVACERRPGLPYRAALFRAFDAAQEAVRALTPYLWPQHDAVQEYYFNTQNFSR